MQSIIYLNIDQYITYTYTFPSKLNSIHYAHTRTIKQRWRNNFCCCLRHIKAGKFSCNLALG